MFEAVRFFEFEGAYDSSQLGGSSSFGGRWSDYDFSGAAGADYRMVGRLQVVLSEPLVGEKDKVVMHLQSFSHMVSGGQYYTRRSGYDSLLLLYTYDGHGRLRYGGKDYELGPDDAFLIDCTKEHEYQSVGDGWHHADLHFYGGFSKTYYREHLMAFSPVFHCQQPESFQRMLEDVLLAHQDDRSDHEYRSSFELELLLFNLKDWMGEGGAVDMTRDAIQKLRNYLGRHYAESVSLDDMSALVGLSKYHLCRQFKRVVGMSPKEYVIHLRIQQAQQLLAATNIPSYRIGALVGFKSEAGFIRHFRQATGTTPQGFRNGNGAAGDGQRWAYSSR